MIILLSGVLLALLLIFIPRIWNICISTISEWRKIEPTKDSKFRILKDVNDKIHIQFSNDGGKKYYDIENASFRDEADAKKILDNKIARLNKTEKVLYEYDPHRLRITDGSEKEFQEEEDTL